MAEKSSLTFGELTFDVRFEGNPEHELVFFLHGFPETSKMWEELMTKIAANGYYCVAPNQRGYSQNGCPKGKKNYKIDLLRNDVIGMVDALGKEKFHLVGHDWGAMVGWNVAYTFPERILSWTSLSIPHPESFKIAYKEHELQHKKSSYIKLFMLPFLPEYRIRKNNFAVFRKLWKHCKPEVLEDYLEVFKNKNTLTAALNYYRANFGKGKGEKIGQIRVPTLFIWGKTDLAVTEYATKNNDRFMDAPFKFVTIEGGHWLVQTHLEEIERELIKHLKKYSGQN